MKTIIISITFLLGAGVSLFAADETRPNIVLIISDDQAWTDYGFMGHADIQTPHLDQLAGRGLLFQRGYVAAPLCRPSLASMATGLYPFQHGITGNDVDGYNQRAELDLPLREAFHQHPTFIKALTASGYLAHQSGKWWEGSWQDGGFTHGMTHGDPTRGGRHGDAGLKIGRAGMQPVTDFIDLAVAQEKPFLLWYAPLLPHTPHNPPQRLLQKYTKKGRAQDVAKYYAMCEWFDETCGELLDYLDQKQITDNTLVLYICDNGWAAPSTNRDDPNQKLWKGYAQRSKSSPYENGIRTPIMVCWPGQVKPDRVTDFAHAIDLFPTIAAAAGLEVPANLTGINLLDAAARQRRQRIFGVCHATHNMTIGDPDNTLQYLWCVEGEWKLLVRYQGQDTTQYRNLHVWDKAPQRLFNLKDDPHEKNDLAKKHPQIVQRLKQAIESWRQSAAVPAERREVPRPDATGRSKPNVLLIAVDDLNDWIGCMSRPERAEGGEHPQAKTPHIDRLARQGVLFSNAHCQSPVCNPSRASLMTSLYPGTSGIYFLNPDLGKSPVATKNTLLPQRFLEEGYYVTGAGKLFHGGQNQKYLPNYGGNFGGLGPMPKQKISSYPGHPLWDWGAYPQRDRQMPDHRIASWAEQRLAEKHDRPLWMGVGFYRPHVPQYVPKKWFDLYPLDTLQLPKTMADDLQDISPYGIDLTRLKHVAPTHEWVTANQQWKPLVQSYLACVSFVDAQVGRVLAALQTSQLADNTYVVLFSDHGFHLGEKQRWAKRSIWQDGAGVPLIITGPGIAKGKTCDKPVQLLDIYPTLLELTGLQPDPKLEGHSLAPLLKNPAADWPHVARSSFGPGNVAIISEDFRFIRYNDGSEELYDRQADPHEWTNLAQDPANQNVLQQHRAWLPTTYHPVLGTGSTGHKAFQAAEENRR
jgi:arylsulfatase A-like enzyme